MNEQDTCVSLINSTVCSAFAPFYIGLPGLGQEFPFLLNITTIEEFDRRLLEYVNSTSDYLFPLGCLSSNYNPTIPYARYSLTRLCAGMIQNPAYSLPCNFNQHLTPPPLCKSTCLAWIKSITDITANPSVCSDSIQRNDSLLDFMDQCDSWEGYNGTIQQNCISGIANEPYSCGFGNDTMHACAYCKVYPEDKCCQTVLDCPSRLSGGTIAGIAVGCVLAVLLLLFGLVYCLYKKPHETVQEDEKSPTPLKEEFFVVIHPYPPQMADELALHVGDIICLALHFDDGWALGYNVTTGLKGAFPIVCITPASEDSLSQLLVEQESPKKTLEIYDYKEAESPTSPTFHTPFFSVQSH